MATPPFAHIIIVEGYFQSIFGNCITSANPKYLAILNAKIIDGLYQPFSREPLFALTLYCFIELVNPYAI